MRIAILHNVHWCFEAIAVNVSNVRSGGQQKSKENFVNFYFYESVLLKKKLRPSHNSADNNN